MLRKNKGVVRKLDTSCQRRLRHVIKHCFSKTSVLSKTLEDALVWQPFATYLVKELLYDDILL